MTDSVHPTLDELADLHAGLLSGHSLARVRDHVEGCDSCTQELASFDEVSAMLATAGSESITMPAEVAARLDDAVAAASRERTAGVPSLAAKRQQSDQPRQGGRRTPWVLVAGAAAAAVVVIGSIGLNGLQGTDDNTAGSGADSGGSTEAHAERDAPNDDAGDNAVGEGQGKGSFSRANPDLTPDSLPSFASKLAAGRLNPGPLRVTATCQADVPSESTARALQAEVLWQGQPALVVVDVDNRQATVFGCGTGGESLYSTSY